MNRTSARYWLRYIATVQTALGLGGWKVDLVDEPPDRDDANASISLSKGRAYAEIRLAADFEDRLTRQEKRQTITHELIHLIFADATVLVGPDGPLVELLGRPSHYVTWEAWRLAFEGGVDWIAELLAPHVPLPPP